MSLTLCVNISWLRTNLKLFGEFYLIVFEHKLVVVVESLRHLKHFVHMHWKCLNQMIVKVIPEMYILRRWTIEVHYGIVHDFRGKKIEGDLKLYRTRQFRQFISKFIKMAVDASPSEEVICTKSYYKYI